MLPEEHVAFPTILAISRRVTPSSPTNVERKGGSPSCLERGATAVSRASDDDFLLNTLKHFLGYPE